MIAQSALLALAASVARAQVFTEVDVYSTNNCNPDPNDLEVQNMQLGFSPSTDDKGQAFSGCMSANIGLPGWPTTDNGEYQAWIDTGALDSGCSLLFYNSLGSEEEFNDFPCRSLYRKVQKDRTACGDLELTENFGYAYCCGSLCNDDITSWPDTKKRSVEKRSAPKDVTKIKRSPINSKREECIIEGGDSYTTYGPQIKVGQEEKCEKDQTSCGQDWSYSVGTEVSTSTSVELGITMGIDEFVVMTTTFTAGFERTESESKEFTSTKHMAPEPGHAGYPTFQPLYVCGTPKMEGSCSRENLGIDGDTVCVQKFLPQNIPDGKWQMVTVD